MLIKSALKIKLFFFELLCDLILQNYLQSIMTRIEEWRIKSRDTEEWMQHRQLPEELRERIRRFVQYKWLATRGVDEESILQSLPLDIRREIQKHLCLGLVRRVSFFWCMHYFLIKSRQSIQIQHTYFKGPKIYTSLVSIYNRLY